MTYCLGIQVEEGLIGIADTRILSGNECRIAKKSWVYQSDGMSLFVMTSGLRSVRDKILMNFEEHLERSSEPASRLFKVVNDFSAHVRASAEEDARHLEAAGLHFNFHAIVGGQCASDKTHKLYLVYPQGNWVEVGTDTPYEIVGASGYGKPILERSLTYRDSLSYAFKVGCLSFDSSRVCAADVGYPIDVILYPRNSFAMIEHRYYQEDLRDISAWWQDRLRKAVNELPGESIQRAFAKLTQSAAADSS